MIAQYVYVCLVWTESIMCWNHLCIFPFYSFLHIWRANIDQTKQSILFTFFVPFLNLQFNATTMRYSTLCHLLWWCITHLLRHLFKYLNAIHLGKRVYLFVYLLRYYTLTLPAYSNSPFRSFCTNYIGKFTKRLLFWYDSFSQLCFIFSMI